MLRKNIMKKLMIVFQIMAVILSDVMCAAVAYSYCDMLWGIRYAGYSAPASVAFLLAVPFIIGILILLVLAEVFRRKIK